VFSGNGLQQSAVVLHMLRRLIGDEAFKSRAATVLPHVAVQEGRHGRSSPAFETAAGRPLSRFRAVGDGLDAATAKGLVANRRRRGRRDDRVDQIGDVFDVPLTVGIDLRGWASREVE